MDEKVYDSTAEKKEQDVPGSSTMIDSVIVILKKIDFFSLTLIFLYNFFYFDKLI